MLIPELVAAASGRERSGSFALTTQASIRRRCSFCGRTADKERPIVAAAAGHVCGVCLSTPADGLVYHRSQVHSAPTHPLEIYLYDPKSAIDRQIYPLKPYAAPRVVYTRKMAAAYAGAGDDWCREHNHHCDGERFDSGWVGPVAVDAGVDAAAFLVQFGTVAGSLGDSPDSSVPPERIVVTCRALSQPAQTRCGETRLEDARREYHEVDDVRLLQRVAHDAGAGRRSPM